MAFVADTQGCHRLDGAQVHRGNPPIHATMGMSSAGKAIAQELAARLRWVLKEGDTLHPQVNVAKMHAGIALDALEAARHHHPMSILIESAGAAPGSLRKSAGGRQ